MPGNKSSNNFYPPPLLGFGSFSFLAFYFYSFVKTFVQFDRPIMPILIDVIRTNDGFSFMLLFYNPMGSETLRRSEGK